MPDYDDLQSEVRTTVADLTPGRHRLAFVADGQKFEFMLRIEEGASALLVHFHGAVNREKREIPKFPSWVPDVAKAHQISIPDPSMSLLDRPFNNAWYAGHEGFDTQAILRATFAAVTQALGVERTIYFGNSGGGFAALYYSHCHPGSFAVAGNPQTSILEHRGIAVSNYRTHCWPSLASDEEVAAATCTDLPRLYGQGFQNTIIYVQSLGDRFHYVTHMLPFVQAIAGQPDAGNLILHSDFHGTIGHAAAPKEYLNWMQAIVRSHSPAIPDILATLHVVRGAPEAPAVFRHKRRSKPVAKAADNPAFDHKDVAMAERLRKWRGRAS